MSSPVFLAMSVAAAYASEKPMSTTASAPASSAENWLQVMSGRPMSGRPVGISPTINSPSSSELLLVHCDLANEYAETAATDEDAATTSSAERPKIAYPMRAKGAAYSPIQVAHRRYPHRPRTQESAARLTLMPAMRSARSQSPHL